MGTGKEIRDFLYADDLVDFIKRSLRKQKTQYEIFNCGSGEPITVKELCEKIIKISRKDTQIKFNKAKPSIPFDMFLDCSKAKKEIDWSPKTNIDQASQKHLIGGRKILKNRFYKICQKI